MDSKNLDHKGKYLTKLLRHQPEELVMDDYGYVSIPDVCAKLNITAFDLDYIVDNNSKSRFKYNADKTKIKATQGHSLNVKYELEPIEPPAILYHGTSIDNMDSIEKIGLSKMSRQHVHMSENKNTAYEVGMRYAKKSDKVVILNILANEMFEDGYLFYQSENGVWLTEEVPPKYIDIN